jgi:tetratricopeptide (TPR) repeat protein
VKPVLARCLLALLVAVATLAHAPAAFAQDQAAEASGHFDRGVSFYRDGDYTAAMVEFKKAYELDPNYRVLFNLGQTSRELRDYASALRSFERYLSEGGTKIDAERRKRVEGWVAELRGKIGNLTITSNVEGAEISVDDIVVGTTPLAAPVVVNAGRRKVSLVKSGYAPRSQLVDVAGTETKELRLDLSGAAEGGPARPAPVTGTTPATPRPAPERRGTARPWVALGITGAVAVAAGITGGLALSKKSDFDDALETYPNDKEAIDDARSGARGLAATADVLAAVAVAGGVITVVLFATDSSSSSSAASTGARSPGGASTGARSPGGASTGARSPGGASGAKRAPGPTVGLRVAPSRVGLAGTF